jgi:hypothetical protein
MRWESTPYNGNRREYRAMRSGRYPKAQYYAVDHLWRLALHNTAKLRASILLGERNPLRVEYRGLP